MSDDLDLALRAATAAADVIRASWGTDVITEFKGEVDPVTEVDLAAEDALVAVLVGERPDDALLGEERGGRRGPGRTWIVDPLDGTVNYVHRLPHVAVSVALWDGDEPLVGVVVDVGRSEVFAASTGGGATLDGAAIGVSATDAFDQSLVGTGFPYDRRQRADAYLAAVGRVLSRAMGIRRLGSAALDLCWVACGRFDAYWEPALGPWDGAAGILIVEEAGGTVTGYGGAPHEMGTAGVLASNGRLHPALTSAVGERP